MHLKQVTVVILPLLWNANLLAKTPADILQSCRDSEPANISIKMESLSLPIQSESKNPNCRDQYKMIIDGHFYGWTLCYKKPFLIIADKKYSTELAENYSLNPHVKPMDHPILPRPLWYRIDKESKSYLCLITPLSENGAGANYYQYYIVEDAFDANRTNYNISYYFFKTRI